MNDQVNDLDVRRDDVIDLLEGLKEKVEMAKGVLLSQNCIVNREEFLHILGTITYNLPNELKQAKWLLNQQHQLINQARQDADNIIAETEGRAVQMIDEHEITVKARELAEQIIYEAQQRAEQIHQGAINYTNQRLSEVEERLTQVLVEIRKDKQQL